MSRVLFLVFLLFADFARAADLTIVILEGEGSFNNVKKKLGRDIRVEVRDDHETPVADADVVFTAPAFGASVSFNKQAEFRARTDERGQAKTTGLMPNTTEGKFNIRVIATSQERTGSVVVSQTNTLAGGIENTPTNSPTASGGGGMNKKALLWTLISAGATAGILIATSSGGNSSTVISGGGPVSLSVGTVTVGGPR